MFKSRRVIISTGLVQLNIRSKPHPKKKNQENSNKHLLILTNTKI